MFCFLQGLMGLVHFFEGENEGKNKRKSGFVFELTAQSIDQILFYFCAEITN